MRALVVIIGALLGAAAAGDLAAAHRGFALGLRAAKPPADALAAEVSGGEAPADLGARCEAARVAALRAFDEACRGGDEATRAALAWVVDARLELVFRRAVARARDMAVEGLLVAPATADAFALRADAAAAFSAAAARAALPAAGWDAAVDIEGVHTAADGLAAARRGAAEAQLGAADAQGHYLAIYQALQSEVQQLQQLQYKQPPPFTAGFAYRVRDTDISVSGGFQQGRGQFQVSAVDDETRMDGEPAVVTAPSHGNIGFSVNL